VTSALSSQTGSATFQADPFTGSTGTLESGPTFISKWYGQKSEMVSIPVTTADELVSQGTSPPDFVKIDVEGHELSVLEGATETLRQHRPMLMMEVTANAEAVGRLLADLSYELVDPANGQKLSRPQAATAAIPK
jgi:FkbM family methyltransferase